MTKKLKPEEIKKAIQKGNKTTEKAQQIRCAQCGRWIIKHYAFYGEWCDRMCFEIGLM